MGNSVSNLILSSLFMFKLNVCDDAHILAESKWGWIVVESCLAALIVTKKTREENEEVDCARGGIVCG